MINWETELPIGGGKRFKALADGLAQTIRSGRLKSGAKMPTHRDLAKRLGLSVSTVTRAYAELQVAGLIHGVVGTGSFVSAGFNPKKAFRAFSQAARPPAKSTSALEDLMLPLLHRSGLVDLSLNEPFQEFSVACIRSGLESVLENFDVKSLSSATAPSGAEAHRQAGAQWLRAGGIPVNHHNIFLTPGSQSGLAAILMALCKPEDVIVAEALTWPGLISAAKLLGIEIASAALDSEGMDPDDLERLCKLSQPKLLYTMPTLHNPLALTTTLERRKAIAQIAMKYDLIVVEDDAYGFLLQDKPPSYFEMIPNHTIYLSSLSKSVSPILRIGFAAAGEPLLKRLLPALLASSLTISPLIAEVAFWLISEGKVELCAVQQAQVAKKRQRMADELIGQTIEPASASSMHRWVEIGKGRDSMQFVAQLLRYGISVSPGALFSAVPGTDPRGFRMCLCAEPSEKRLRSALLTVGALLRGKVLPTPVW